ncbi:MAG: hypothetical protein LBI29_01595 [Rickettsiales bacterium]|nr:hypothetical protein [Rickettsiales bacterium]
MKSDFLRGLRKFASSLICCSLLSGSLRPTMALATLILSGLSVISQIGEKNWELKINQHIVQGKGKLVEFGE